MAETIVKAVPDPLEAERLATEIIGDKADVVKAGEDIKARIAALQHTIRMCEAEIAVLKQLL